MPGSLVGVEKERATVNVNPSHARQGLLVSLASIAWTVIASTAEIVLGLQHHVLTLVVFGLAGALDAVGSSALAVHFRHALRHDVLAERHERRAMIIVNTGLVALGVVTSVESIRRLATGHVGSSTGLGVAVAAAAVVVLGVLASIKVRVARDVGSPALASDGYLSATGALLAVVAVVGATVGTRAGLTWVDPAAAMAIALVAAGVGAVEMRRGLAD
ncbi:MAG TPA: cation transporter [Acidimicrobiales bacterium]|nr:cation transporter [Acidimicrobiales bacterium]